MTDVQNFISACRDKNLNVTYQRILIYKSLMANKSHPTAEEIYKDVKQEYPSISLATVYKTLETFALNELIGKVTQLHDLARYDADMDMHHHLVCLKCRKVIDIHDEHLNKLNLPQHDAFHISGYRIQFEGVCKECEVEELSGSNEGETTFCGK